MKSYPWKKAVIVFVLLVLAVWVNTLPAQDQRDGRPPLPPPPVPWAVYGDYLYVLDMYSIHQYSLSDMRLKSTVALPQPQVVALSGSTRSTPPMPPRGVSLLAEGDALFVWDARSIHKYQLPGLLFLQTVTLPEPDDAVE
jgi:hypothetical protein